MAPRSAAAPDLRELLAPGVIAAERELMGLHEEDGSDKLWRNKIFRRFPPRFALRIARAYEEEYVFEGRQAANHYLLEHLEHSNQEMVPLSASDYELEQLAKKYADRMRELAMIHHNDIDTCVNLWKRATAVGISPPSPDDPNITIRGAICRLCDKNWWLRQLRCLHARRLEQEAIRLGFVHRRAGHYVSEETLERFREQKKRSRRMLSRMIAINEEEQAFSVAELAQKGVSNPVNRRNELMARIFGFERIADDLGHVAEFYTLTCPSRMHARLSKSGESNPKYDGTTPKAAQAYLTRQWARIRAELKRQGILIYGFRIVEPHKDGTPHWHLLLFLPPESIEQVRTIFLHYALQEDGDEEGALEHRFTGKPIDKAKGSAIGYIAKYVSKNIDGYAIEEADGQDAKSKAERVIAWASTWGIRQFQQFGGAPVTLWRELRRASANIPAGILQEAFEAADNGDWARFLQAMGGAAPKRKDLPIQLAKQETDETGRYGDPVGKKIIGVEADSIILPTRIHQWRIMTIQEFQPDKALENPEGAERWHARTDARNGAHRADVPAAKPPLEFCQ